MNKQLTEAIVKHVLANLAVIPSNFVNLDTTKSLMEKQFFLGSKIRFAGDASRQGGVWGCQLSAEDQEIKMILGDCSQEAGIPEFALLVQLKNAPCYGLYFVGNMEDSESMIACSVNGIEWLECNSFLQASFLSGMEQVRETGLSWYKCKSYEEELEKLLSFISYHHQVYGGVDEGQED